MVRKGLPGERSWDSEILVVADDERQGVVVRGHMGRVGTVPRVYRAPGTPLDSHEGMKAPGGADLHFIPKIKHSVTTKE